MRKALLITMLLIPFFGFSQTTKPIEGFLGIKFGTSKAAVLAAMKAKGAIYDVKNSSGGSAFFNNVKLGSRKTEAFIVKFFNDKAYFAMFVFVPYDEPKTIEYYYGLVNDLNSVYGTGSATTDFKSPFKDGDGNEILALRQGYATMSDDWQSGTNSIQVTIDNKSEGNKLNVLAFYQDDTVAAAVAAAKKAKEKSDY